MAWAVPCPDQRLPVEGLGHTLVGGPFHITTYWSSTTRCWGLARSVTNQMLASAVRFVGRARSGGVAVAGGKPGEGRPAPLGRSWRPEDQQTCFHGPWPVVRANAPLVDLAPGQTRPGALRQSAIDLARCCNPLGEETTRLGRRALTPSCVTRSFRATRRRLAKFPHPHRTTTISMPRFA